MLRYVHEVLPKKSEFDNNGTKILGVLHEALSTVYCFRRYDVVIKPLLYNTPYFCIVDSDM